MGTGAGVVMAFGLLGLVSISGAAMLITAAVIDHRHHRIPNPITYSAAGICIVLVAVGAMTGHGDRSLAALLGGCLFAGILYVPHHIKPSAMGLGDIKLAWPLGFAIGWTQAQIPATAMAVGWTVAGASLIGLVMAAFTASRRGERMRSGQAVAFGPALSAAGMLAVLAAIV